MLENISDNTPLRLYEPFSFMIFLSFYSPIIIATSIGFLSIVFQNFKGFIFLGFLIASLLGREFIYWLFYFNKRNSGDKSNMSMSPMLEKNKICSSIQYSPYGNATFSAFVFAFTILYLSIPMFINGGPNFWVFFVLLVYFFLDIGIKMYKKCVIQMGDLFINVLVGGGLASAIVMSMYAGNSSKFLFFNEISSNKDVCSMPSKQTFKCSVFKNGELIGSV